MSEKAIDRIRHIKKENRDLVNELRRSLQENLEEFCKSLGGHFFWEWQEETDHMMFGYKVYQRRRCQACDKIEETLKEENFSMLEE